MKNANAKHQESILDCIKKKGSVAIEEIKEQTKISDILIRSLLKNMLTENLIVVSPDDGTYSINSSTKKIQPQTKDSTKTEVKAIPKAEKKKDESDLGPKHAPGAKGIRDQTRYTFNNKPNLPKGRLILELVAQYISDHKKANIKQINEAFLAEKVQKRYLVLRPKNEATKFTLNKKTRFFLQDKELLTVLGVKCAVCSQWDILNTTQVISAFKGTYKVSISK